MNDFPVTPSPPPALKITHGDAPSVSAPPAGYGDFLLEIKSQIRQRQFQALRAANKELLALYWWLGENISQRQLALGWGKGVVENLARDLQAEFPGRNGFSAQNLWLMRQFFNEYADKPKLQPLVREISWAKNLVILGRCKDDLEREFYLRATARFGWTKSVLQHQLTATATPNTSMARPTSTPPCPTASKRRRCWASRPTPSRRSCPPATWTTCAEPGADRSAASGLGGKQGGMTARQLVKCENL